MHTRTQSAHTVHTTVSSSTKQVHPPLSTNLPMQHYDVRVVAQKPLDVQVVHSPHGQPIHQQQQGMLLHCHAAALGQLQ